MREHKPVRRTSLVDASKNTEGYSIRHQRRSLTSIQASSLLSSLASPSSQILENGQNLEYRTGQHYHQPLKDSTSLSQSRKQSIDRSMQVIHSHMYLSSNIHPTTASASSTTTPLHAPSPSSTVKSSETSRAHFSFLHHSNQNPTGTTNKASSLNLHIASSSRNPAHATPVTNLDTSEASYNGSQYLMYLLARKMSSTNFIHRMESKDLVTSKPHDTFKCIGPYVVGKIIGRGAYGKVKYAICSETLQTVAIKILKHQRLRKLQSGVAGLTKEIQLLRSLHHTNCIRLLEVYAKIQKADSQIEIVPWHFASEYIWNQKTLKRYLVFEHCETTLQTLLDSAPNGRFPLLQIQDYFIQLIEGLQYLHAHRIIHRDIKPANLLLKSDGVLKISDFGVAERLSHYTSASLCQNFAGTQQYMSPEVARGDLHPDGEKVDVWASGVTLYNMVYGTFPYQKEGEEENLDFLERLQKYELSFPIETLPELTSLFQGMLAKNPMDRMTVFEILRTSFMMMTLPGDKRVYVPLPTVSMGTLVSNSQPNDIFVMPSTHAPQSLFPVIEPMFPELAETYQQNDVNSVTSSSYLYEKKKGVLRELKKFSQKWLKFC